MSRADLVEQRRAAVTPAGGKVLAVGFGFGGTLPAYPSGAKDVERLVELEPSLGMTRRAARRIASAPFPVEVVRAGAEAMPFENGSFDTVVSTWTLCSIPGLAAAFREIRRVLRPGGRFLFLEHGRADDPRVARWQARLNPIHRLYAGGCRLDLPIDALVREGGFAIESLERYEGRPGPRPMIQMYRGAARPA